MRPEHISLVAPNAGYCAGTVEVVEYLGADLMVYIESGALGLVTVRHSGDGEVAVGDRVGLGFAPERMYFFDEDAEAIHLTPA